MIPIVKPFLPEAKILMPKLEAALYSGYIAEGQVVKNFETQLSLLLKNPYCLTTNSGTAALHLALSLIGIGHGDEVISTALTAEPTNTTIALTGAKVVFADVDPQNGLLSPESIEQNINERTKAIMVVHYAGMVCDMDRINIISKKYDIPVIEDAAHALLSKYDGQYIGSNSAYTCFSFQAIKHLTTVDGGLLCLKNEVEYVEARKLRWFGLDKEIPRLENNIKRAGFKYHMNNINATIGLVQLGFIRENVHKYIENGKYFDQKLNDISGVQLPLYNPNTEPSYWLYTVLVENREDFIKMMSDTGIAASPLHLRNDRHSVFAKLKRETPGLDEFYEKFVHIPSGWWLSVEDRDKIVNAIKRGW